MPNDERRTTNDERRMDTKRTTNDERRTTNDERRTLWQQCSSTGRRGWQAAVAAAATVAVSAAVHKSLPLHVIAFVDFQDETGTRSVPRWLCGGVAATYKDEEPKRIR